MNIKQEIIILLELIFKDNKLKYFREYDFEENKKYIETIGFNFLKYAIEKIKIMNNKKAKENIKLYKEKYGNDTHIVVGFILVVCNKYLLEYSGESICQYLLYKINPKEERKVFREDIKLINRSKNIVAKKTIIEKKEYLGDKLNLDFYKNFLTSEESISVFNTLEKQTKWSNLVSEKKRVNQTYGDDGLVYEINFYGKITKRKALPWSDIPILEILRNRITEITKESYNICVIQRYPNGKIGINPHRDKEMKLGTTIVGLSLGETRTLSMSRNNSIIDISLSPGSLYVFNSPTNSYWAHSIKKDETTKPRISLTFRTYE